MRRILLLLASAAFIVAGSVLPGMATANGSHDTAGQESQDAADAINWFTDQRLAPNGTVDPGAFASAVAQSAALPSVAGTWTERTGQPGTDGNDFSDPPAFIDPTSNFSNSGFGNRNSVNTCATASKSSRSLG